MATKKATTKAASKKKTAAKKTAPKKAVATKVTKKDVDIKSQKIPKPSALIAELTGTFVLTGAFFALFAGGTEGIIGISLVLITLVIIFGVISHAHFNPAISIALWANRKISGVRTVLYIAAQVIGAMLAFLVFKAIFAATNGIDMFAGSEVLIMESLGKQGITQEVVDQAGGLLQFAQANGFTDIAQLAKQVGVTTFVDNNISGMGLSVFFAELVGAIIFGLGVGVAFFKRNKPIIKALALGFGLFAGLIVGGSAVILNPAVAAALGSFSHGWGVEAADVMWPIVTYIVATIAGVIIGATAYRYLLKDTGCDENCKCDDCDY